MNLTQDEFDILEHARDRAAGGYYCGDSEAMQSLVAAGLMESAGFKGFCPDEFFQLTRQGRVFLMEHPARP